MDKRTTTIGALIEADDFDAVYDQLESAEVVEGPPELRNLVAGYFPQFLHKVKPPKSEMH